MKTKKIIAIALFTLTSNFGVAQELTVPLIRVIDGDTIETRLESLPLSLQKVYIRVRGVDTPETSVRLARCLNEIERGKKAKLALKELTQSVKVMTLSNLSWDKYGGRIDADVSIEGLSLSKWLLDNGYAKAYTGKTKSSWCEVNFKR